MDLRKLKTLIDLVAESDISELEVTEGESKVRIVKSTAHSAQNQVVMMPSAAVAAPAAAPAVAAAPLAAPAAVPEAAPTGHIVKSPMVGTFYRAASPEAEAFCKPGDRASSDTTLCIIEAMKVMNEIKAEKEFEVLEVLVKNGDPVEFGQPLFLIR